MADRQKLRKHAQSRLPVTGSFTSSFERAAPHSQPLDLSLRGALEPRFGHSFANVRVHADGEADQLASRFGARAFTNGNDVFFRSDEYSPETAGGQHLLAHELTHVVQQQRFGTPGGLRVSHSNDASEIEAHAAADAVLAGQRASVQSASVTAIARDEEKEHGPDLSELNEELNEHSPLKDTPFRVNPFPQEAPDPHDDPRAESQKEWDKSQAERRGDKYPSPLTDPKPVDPKDPHKDPSYWKPWGRPLPPDMPQIPLPVPPWLRPPWLQPSEPWLKPSQDEPKFGPGDYPVPDEEWRYA